MLILIAGLLILFLISLFFTYGDFLRPSTLVSAIMFMASVCTAYLSPIWGFSLGGETVGLILGAVSVIVAVDVLVLAMYRPRRNCMPVSIPYIYVNKIVLILVILFNVVTIAWHFQYLVNSVGFAGTLSHMVTQYRQSVVYGIMENAMPGLLSRMIRICKDLAYIYVYIFVNNCLVSKNIKKNLFLLFPVVFYFVDSLLWGARGYILYVIFAAIVYVYILYQRRNGWKMKNGMKLIRKIGFFGVAVSIIFVALGNFVGRSATNGIFYRLSLYFGGGIALFDAFLKDGGATSSVPGMATFYNLFKFIDRRFGINSFNDQYMQFEFRNGNGLVWGNVYTALRRYYMDYQTMGVILLSAGLALFFAIFYSYIRRKRKFGDIDISVLLYGIMSRSMFLFFFDDRLYMDFFTPSIVVILVELFLCVFLVTNVDISKRGFKIFRKKKKHTITYRSE